MGLIPRRASEFHGEENCVLWFTDFTPNLVYLSLNYVALVPRGPTRKCEWLCTIHSNYLKSGFKWVYLGCFFKKFCLPSSFILWTVIIFSETMSWSKAHGTVLLMATHICFPTFIYFSGKRQCDDPRLCCSVQASSWKYLNIISLTLGIGLRILYK